MWSAYPPGRRTPSGAVLAQSFSRPSLQRAQSPQLQVYSGSKEIFGDGEWVSAPPCPTDPHGFTINIGDMLQVISGGVYKAPEHRVLKTSMEVSTYSAAFFYNPSYEAVLTNIVGGEVAKQEYRDLEWKGYRRRRWEGDYEDVGLETQIEHYLVR